MVITGKMLVNIISSTVTRRVQLNNPLYIYYIKRIIIVLKEESTAGPWELLSRGLTIRARLSYRAEHRIPPSIKWHLVLVDRKMVVYHAVSRLPIVSVLLFT